MNSLLRFFSRMFAERRRRRADEIVEELNRVYADGPTEEERRVVAGIKAKNRERFRKLGAC